MRCKQKIDLLFFQLIRVAIGTQTSLSHMPNADEWRSMYSMAKKQSLVGVCFAGVQKLVDHQQTPEEMLYLTWMGMTAKIQQRNQVVDEQCVALQKRLSEEGIASRVLKGQGVATLYGKQLQKLRQSGDIDLWMIEPKEKILAWAEKVGMVGEPGYLHVGARIFEGTEVELHYRPTYCRCLWYNNRLQEFCGEHTNDFEVRGGIIVPSWEFDVVYQISHIYRHLFGLGIGFRQLMDYYFLLVNANDRKLTVNLPLILSRLGLLKFAGAVMYVMHEIFHLEEQYMICPVDEKRGKMLLRQVMQTGNFGKMDKEQKEARSSVFGIMKYKLSQWWELVRFYPEETLSAPLWSFVRRFD